MTSDRDTILSMTSDRDTILTLLTIHSFFFKSLTVLLYIQPKNITVPDNKSIELLISDRYYHIFNRGNNYNTVFFKPENYYYFLKKYYMYLSNYIDTYAYCLINNHFHFLIRTKEKIIYKNREIVDQTEIGRIIGQQFRYFFIAYSMHINIQEHRSGSLFLKNFKRVMINDEYYLKYIIFYIHYNPVKHNIVNNISSYRYSSYNSLLYKINPEIKAAEVLNGIFNSINEFADFHSHYTSEKKIKDIIIEE